MNDLAQTQARRPEPRLADFPYRHSDTIRYGDLDRQQHVNNAVFSTFLETGRVMVLRDPTAGFAFDGAEYVLARLVIDFRRELRWPGSVTIATRIARVGRSSVVFDQALFMGEECAATAESTVVLVDPATRRSRPLPGDLAERLKATLSS